MNTKHGVLTNMYLAYYDGKEMQFEGVLPDEDGDTLEDLCEIAVRYQLTQLWVLPDTLIKPDRQFFEAALPDWDLFATWTFDETEEMTEELTENALVSVTGCRRPKGGQHWFSIGFVQNCQWTWADDELTYTQLLQIVDTLEKTLGVPIGVGPTTAGTRTLEKVWPDKGRNIKHEFLTPPTIDLGALPFDKAASDIVWERPLLPTERTFQLPRKRLVKVDKRSAHLRSCQEQMGVGTPVHVFTDQGIMENLPGIWKISRIHPDSASMFLPPPLWDNAEWVSTPIVRLLKIKLGYEVLISEGWQFPKRWPLLRKWSEGLYKNRRLLEYDPAYDGIKDIATKTVGLFKAEALREENARKRNWKYRPDWWCQVVGNSRALMFYNMLAVREQCGLTPVMVYMDALYYVIDGDDASVALPGLTIGPNLGNYKQEWALPLDYEVIGILDSSKGPALKLEALNDLADEEDFDPAIMDERHPYYVPDEE